MNAKFLASLLLAAMVAGCAAEPAKTPGEEGKPGLSGSKEAKKPKLKPPKPCNGTNCDSTVDVAKCALFTPCELSYDVVLLAKAKGARPTILFHITTSDSSGGAVAFKSIAFDKSELIGCDAVDPKTTTDWKCYAKVDLDADTYKFTIDVDRVGFVDPWLIND